MTQPRDETPGRKWRFGGDPSSRELVWGMASQGGSSVTNFGLTLIAARVLGPEGLGVVFVGFSLYLVLLGFTRAFIGDPLVALSSTVHEDDRKTAQRAALTILTAFSIGVAVLVAVAGFLLPGPIGPGLIAFAPWLFPALLQDFWRVVLFQQRRGRAGAFNDLIWVFVMAATVPLAFRVDELWAVIACWGLGAAAGSMLGFFQTRIRFLGSGKSARWWRMTAWPMGRWLGLESLAYGLTTQGLVFVLVFLLGPSPMGGLRAVQSVYAPLSLVGAALALPSLPEMTRRLRVSALKAREYALRLGVFAGFLTALYISLIALAGSGLLARVFGDGFSGYEDLVWPIGTAQLVGAVLIAFPILLKAMQRGRALLTVTLTGSVVTLVASTLFAIVWGILGAAWGIALGGGFKGTLTAVFATRRSGASSPSGV